jgi:excisionase family DNA binding protein
MKWLTVRDVCESLRIKADAVYGWINSGELKAVNVVAKANAAKARWRIDSASLDEFLRRRAATPPAPAARRRRPQGSEIREFV